MAKKRFFKGTLYIAAVMVAAFGLAGCKDSTKQKKEAAQESTEEADVRTGEMAPSFKLTTFSGGTFNLDEAKGSPVVVNFWASWCGPCRLEAAEIEKSYNDFKSSGVRFVGVAVQDNDADSKKFIEEFKWSLPAGPDSTGGIMKSYRIFGVPKTVVIGRDGRLSYIHTGTITGEILAREIKKVM